MPIHDWTRVDAGVFHDFHLSWIASLKRTLNAGVLPSDFYAMAEQVAGPGNPDVLALQLSDGERRNGPPPTGEGEPSSVALATAAPRVRFQDQAEDEVYARKARSLVVRRTNGDRVIAVIEIVSPGNKGSRAALRSFVTKAVDYLNAGVHLLILDLFPPTARDPQGIHPAVWSEIVDRPFELPADKRLTLVAYAAGLVKRAFIEPVGVGDVLPEMPLYLTPSGHVPVPLESTYQAAWADVPRRWQQVLEPLAGS
jgi:hypothetical protein